MQARRQAERFDAVITAANEADLGPRGIQYIHSGSVDERERAAALVSLPPRRFAGVRGDQ